MTTTTRTKQIDSAALNVLANSTCSGNALRLPPGQLDRKLYEAVNAVLTALGGKWNRKAQAHLFESDPAELVEEAVLTGAYSRTKQDFGLFETPEALVRQVLDAADLELGMAVLEPSAGPGRLAVEIARSWKPRLLTCFEIQPVISERLRANLLFADQETLLLECQDFLSATPKPMFDRVVMNPPFAKRADIHHIRHAFRFLNPGGRLVSIASASVRFRDDALARDFRAFVADNDGEIEALPDGAFKESGTLVNTVLVTALAPD